MKVSALRGLGVAGAAAAVLAVGCARQERHEAASIAWYTTYDAALTDAGRTGRPVLLDFYTDW